MDPAGSSMGLWLSPELNTAPAPPSEASVATTMLETGRFQSIYCNGIRAIVIRSSMLQIALHFSGSIASHKQLNTMSNVDIVGRLTCHSVTHSPDNIARSR
eukprot:2597671-Amphidinium_carterae.1